MPDHVFSNEYGEELLAVMYRKCQPNELGEDSGPARPGLYDLSALGLSRFLDLSKQMSINKWSLF
jgi:hypothetical protein